MKYVVVRYDRTPREFLKPDDTWTTSRDSTRRLFNTSGMAAGIITTILGGGDEFGVIAVEETTNGDTQLLLQ